MADAADSKSVALKSVRVQVPPSALPCEHAAHRSDRRQSGSQQVIAEAILFFATISKLSFRNILEMQ